MEPAIIYLILLLLPLFLLFKRISSKRLPPGSMGLPIVGHSLGFLNAMRTNKAEKWLQERVTRYGPISKLGLFGAPTVFLHGPAANKFIYTSDSNTLANQQPVLSDEEILDNAFVSMLAGYETTSILLTFLVRLLANNPSIHAKVIQEQEQIAKKKAPETLLTWDDLANMKYTWRVATEKLRMYPPVFCSFRKTLKDIEYGGYIIPKGWQLVWAAFMTHMDDNIFPNASKFDPSRYEQGAAPPYSFIPFGGGPRICPGYEFARIETLTMIHYLATRFTWKLASKDDSFCRDPMPVFNQGLPIKIEQRNCANPI